MHQQHRHNLMSNNKNNSSQGNPNDGKYSFSTDVPPSSLQNLMNLADAIQFSDEEDLVRDSAKTGDDPVVQLQLMGENEIIAVENNNNKNKSNGNKRKRARTMKSNEEVESQRMIHIAVERNRRKQMNEHLNVLKSLMPRSYVQRGDQASIIGGAIEFVKELEQLLQCLESQKRRRLYGDDECPPKLANIGESSNNNAIIQHQLSPSLLPLLLPIAAPLSNDDHQLKFDLDYEAFQQLQEETAESKSVLADVQVKLLGLDNMAMIKILSRRRHGQLINTITALEELQFDILQTNVTTIEQTVLYSFHVKVEGEVRYTAEDIANFVQQTVSFIHGNTNFDM